MKDRTPYREHIRKVYYTAQDQEPPLNVEQYLRREFRTKTDRQIGKACEVPASAIRTFRKEYGITRKDFPRKVSLIKIEEIAQRAEPPTDPKTLLYTKYVIEQKSDAAIGEALGISTSEISKLRKELGISTIPQGDRKLTISEERREELRKHMGRIRRSGPRFSFPEGGNVDSAIIVRLLRGENATKIASDGKVKKTAILHRINEMRKLHVPLPELKRGRPKQP